MTHESSGILQHSYYNSNTTSLDNWIGFWKFDTSSATNSITNGSLYLTDSMNAPVGGNTLFSYLSSDGIDGSNMGSLVSSNAATRMVRNATSRPGGGSFGSFSVMMWIKTTDSSSTYNFLWRLTQNSDASGDASTYIAGTGGGTTAAIYGSVIIYTPKYLIADNNWHSYVWVFTPTSLTIYVDGVVFNTTNVAIPPQVINYAMMEDRRDVNGGNIIMDNFGVIGSALSKVDVGKYHAKMYPNTHGKWSFYDITKWFGAWDCNTSSGTNRIVGSTGTSLTIAQGGTYANYADLPFDATQSSPLRSNCFGSPEQNPTGGKVRSALLTSGTISTATFGGWIKPGITRPSFMLYYGSGSTLTLSDTFLTGIVQGASNHSYIRLGTIGGNSIEFNAGGTDVWQHWVVSIDLTNGVAKMYVNGELITTYTYSPSLTSVTGLKILFTTTEGFGYPYSSGYFTGLFAYNGILEQSTIQDLSCKNKFINYDGTIKSYSPFYDPYILIAGDGSGGTKNKRLKESGTWEEFSVTYNGLQQAMWVPHRDRWVGVGLDRYAYTSTDGTIWNPITQFSTGTPNYGDAKGSIVAMVLYPNILKISYNGGLTWDSENYMPTNGSYALNRATIINSRVFVSSIGHISYADIINGNSLSSWTTYTLAGTNFANNIIQKDGILYLLLTFNTTNNNIEIYQSIDNGQSWTINTSINAGASGYYFYYSSVLGKWLLSTSSSPWMYQISNLSNTLGNWTSMSGLSVPVDCIVDINGVVYATQRGNGVYYWNGSAWVQVNASPFGTHYTISAKY